MKKWILILGVIMVLIGASMYAYSSFEKPKISEKSFTIKVDLVFYIFPEFIFYFKTPE